MQRFGTKPATTTRKVKLVEIESSEFSNYIWPSPVSDNHLYVYDSYRNTVDFKNVDKIQLWYNNLPAGETVECKIGSVKAIPMVSVPLENLGIMLNGKMITFPVTYGTGYVPRIEFGIRL